jgi:hypothetical protein
MNGFARTINYLAGLNNGEQPWLLTGRSVSAAGVSKNGSVANDDFKTTQSVWMAMATGTYSRMFAIGNHHTGNSAGSVNPGYRLASDPRSGALYRLFQRRKNAGAGFTEY